TEVTQGELVANNSQALGGTTNGTTIDDGATLVLRSSLDAEPVTLHGQGLSFGGHNTAALRNSSGTNNFDGGVDLSKAVGAIRITIGADSGSELTMPGKVSGGGSGFTLVKEGTGTVALGGDNTYTGLTAVYQGALRLENSNAIDLTTGAEVLDGAQ